MRTYEELPTFHEVIYGKGSEAATSHNFMRMGNFEEYESWLCVCARTRDADPLEESNFDAIKRDLEKIYRDGVYITSTNHWACGYIEYILISPRSKRLIEKSLEILEAIENYPVYDEDAYELEKMSRAAAIGYCYDCYDDYHDGCIRTKLADLAEGHYEDDYHKTSGDSDCVCYVCFPDEKCINCKYRVRSEGPFVKFEGLLFCDDSCIALYFHPDEIERWQSERDRLEMEHQMIALGQPTLWRDTVLTA